MDKLVSKKESYAERRKLFKNIWDTSMPIDDKDDIFSKPKIIKTLRLDEMDSSTTGKKKKHKIKNLRAVCNKLLDFCEHQDADDLFYEQIATQGKQPAHVIETKSKKKLRVKNNVKKAKSVQPSTNASKINKK